MNLPEKFRGCLTVAVVALIMGAPLIAQQKSSVRRRSRLLDLTPHQVVERYCKARFRSFEWKDFSHYITWGDEPGWDEYVLITGFEVGQANQKANTATVSVVYHVIADIAFPP